MKPQIAKCVIPLIFALLTENSKAQSYARAWYYDSAGKKVIGLINIYPYCDYLRYKTDKKASDVKVKIQDISAVVIPNDLTPDVDSLIVMTEDNKPNKRYFAHLAAVTPVRKFYLKYVGNSWGGGPSMTTMTAMSARTGASATTIRWSRGNSGSFAGEVAHPMYEEGGSTYEITRGNFIQILSEAFTDQPQLAQDIKDKKYKYRSVIWLLDEYRMARPVRN